MVGRGGVWDAASGQRYSADRKTSVIAVGVTVQSAPVSVRERLATPEAEVPRVISELCSFPHLLEAGVLSTCNRLELYLVGATFHRAVREAEEWLCRASGLSLEELRPHLFLLRDGDAVEHLLRVASGLESAVLGEGQVLSQVRQASRAAGESPGFGRHLSGLFRAAVTAGKRARAETSISTGSVSVSSAAVQLAADRLACWEREQGQSDGGPSEPGSGDGDSAPQSALARRSVAVLGAGRMARLLVRHLAARGVRSLTLVNRSLERAEALAAEAAADGVDARCAPLEALDDALAASDVVFAAAGGDEPLISREMAVGLPRVGPHSRFPRMFVDIAVPRNVQGPLPENERRAVVFTVDDLARVVEGASRERTLAAREAEEIVAEERAEFEAWRDSLDTVPTIKALRSKAESIRAAETARALARLGAEGKEAAASARLARVVEDLGRGIVNKLLHGPTTSLRCQGPAGALQSLANAEALERMFQLDAEAAEDGAGGKKAPRKAPREASAAAARREPALV